MDYNWSGGFGFAWRGGFFAYKYFLSPKENKEQVQNGTKQEEKQEEAKQEEGPTEIYTLPSFIVNLADPLGRRYLKLSMDVELKNKKVVEEMEKKLPQIKDAIILLLSSKTFADISTVKGKLELKNEIVSRMTQILGQGKVLRVYFTELVVQ
ncbi:flagellar FliL protein [Desulfonauticus submarinus]|uniref:Flagellar protein FliL n=1 Tax=Desulfonauticus submarinus TaxID=206665 RepID=A0A1H0BNY5_9BACT|nr:flagellar FliL protein [Desulfonauticus submarinus]